MSKSFKESLQTFALNQVYKYLEGNPEENIPKLMAWVDRLAPDDYYAEARDAVRKAIDEKGNWYQLILKLYDLDPGVRKAAFQNFLINAPLSGTATQQEIAKRENCNVPWAMLVDPTSACNLHCTGCWAAEYGNRLNLSVEDLDSIIKQGNELGTYMYLYTGGEPLVRKKDLMKICEMHS
ncbi:MAG: radical SAM protein, partial [Lachnospiraceae bacterium]|nr:radical SAM protein [Lachnospiraceae bacterium]